jgi:outer membrane protein assembly factor BamB
MSLSMRRTAVVLLGSGLLALLTCLPQALGQGKRMVGPGVPNAPGTENNNDGSQAIQLPTDSKLKKKLDAARDYMEEKSWGEACRIIQSLLDVKEDVFVEVKRKDSSGKDIPGWVSVRSEANRLLSTMSPEGLEHYRLSYGALAKDLLNQAKTNSDPQLLAQVAQRYLYTEAGVEANNLTGTYLLDRGNFDQAALYFERLLDREGADKLSPSALVKAALAFHRLSEKGTPDENAKYKALEENVWKDLAAKVGPSLRLGDRNVNVADLQDEVKKYRDPTPVGSSDWAMYGGNASRTAQGQGGTPFLEKRWRAETMKEQQTKTMVLDQAMKQYENRGQAVLPAFFPIAADGKLIYRSYWGLRAVDLKTGQLKWEADTKWSFDKMVGDGQKMQHLNTWIGAFNGMGKPNLVFENSVIGTLSTDNNRVYLVDDLPVPPITQMYQFNNPFPNGRGDPSFGVVNEAVYQNKLEAYDLNNGKLLWEAGGPKSSDRKDDNNPKPEKKDGLDLSETYFLGPPLPLHGKLYVLTEKNQELRLLCLDASRGDVSWTQTLAQTQNKLSQDVARRSQAAHLAYGEGILVCPTNAGAILGIDLLSHSLVWAYFYREKNQTTALEMQQMMIQGGMMMAKGMYNPNNPNAPEWKVSAPIIQEGKVVFTAPDGTSIDCLNLRDGTRMWRASRSEEDLYLGGVVNGKVLIVGKKDCRALNLADGKSLWQVPTGTPSGQGVASNGVYYLPLKTALQTKEPAVCNIDIEKGKVIANTKSRKKEVPGNLLLYEGDVISQTVGEVVAYPQLEVKLAQINELMKKNPQDPVGLTEHAEYLLDKGDWSGAVQDLRTALQNNPPQDTVSRTRDKLYEALTEYLQHDFAKAEQYLEEYKALCKVEAAPEASPADRQNAEAEQQRRTANYLCLVAEGRENQGRLTEAFQHYLEFGNLSDKKELLSVVGDRAVKAPADVWAQGRISAMMAKAKPEQRQPLESLIASKWSEIRGTGDLDSLRKFVTMFGSHFKVGRDARLQLAQRLLEEEGTASLPEAERQLLLLRRQQEEPALAAQAVEMLARLMARKGLLEDAAFYYRVLGRDFAQVVVRDGMTGDDFYNELATDKRFLPYLDDPGQVWGTGKMKAKEEHGQFTQTQQVFNFEPEGEQLPYFRRHRVAMELPSGQFRLLDRFATEKDKERVWEAPLARNNNFQNHFQQLMWGNGNPMNMPRFPYHTVGHVIVLPIGHTVFGLDPLNKKVLWEQNLLGSQGVTNNSQLTMDPRDGALQLIYPDGYIQKLGQTGPIEASYVCLQTRDGLVTLDPVSGRVLWTRGNLPQHCTIFGDDEHIYLVELNGEGNAVATHAYRAYDGASIKEVPDFTAVFQQRQRILGRNILASETINGKLVLRVYDVQTGKDVWKREFAANSVVLRAEQPNLAGAIEPGGKVTVVDLSTHQEVLHATVEPKHIEKAQGVTLLQDRNLFYVAINGPNDQNANPWGGPWANLMPGSGLRSVPVNGLVYAWERDSGKLRWKVEVPQQMLILDQADDLPVLIFTSRAQRLAGGGVQRWAINAAAVKCIEKRTGKLIFDQPEMQNAQQFYAFHTDPRSGRIELVSYNMKVICYVEPTASTAQIDAKEKP